MKLKATLVLVFFCLLKGQIFCQSVSCPVSIKVGQSCSCHSCATNITVMPFTTYVANVLTNEWGQWGTWPGGMNSLNAGAVAVRSYAIYRINNPSVHGTSYNICNNTCCHVYNSSATPTSYANTAVSNTSNYILVNGS